MIEDEALLRNLAGRLVRRLGHEVDVAAASEDALELVAKGRYDVVICDFQLGGETAADVLAMLSGVDPDIAKRFVVTSGDSGDADVVALVAASGIRVLPKPFGAEDVAAVLDGVEGNGGRSTARDELAFE